MDNIDQEILKILQKDARTPLKKISGQINLSLPATSERLRKLEASGLIKGYTAILESRMLGKHFSCFCLATLGSQSSKGMDTDFNFRKFADDHPDILECHCIAGDHEYILKIVTESVQSLNLLLSSMRTNCGVVRTKTYAILLTSKESYSVLPQ